MEPQQLEKLRAWNRKLADAKFSATSWPEEYGGRSAGMMVKAFMSDYFAQIAADAIQIFGGAGFTWEYDIQLYYKRLLSLEQTWGAAEVWLEELARLVIDPREKQQAYDD